VSSSPFRHPTNVFVSAGPPARHGSTLRPVAAGPRGIDPAALRSVLCQIGRVDRLEDLGQAGPLFASAGAGSLFHCQFGRDAIRMAFDLLDDFPRVAEATLLSLAALQGVRVDPSAEEEPGRIIHEHRLADDALRPELERRWSFPYYGAVDSTPAWINLLVAYISRAGDTILDAPFVDRLDRPVTLFDTLLAALGWIVGRLDDPAGGGYLWVRRASPDGIANQVWEDSGDSYYHADGTLFDFTRPYAPVAVQGYAYDALLGAAEILTRRRAATPQPSELRARAADLRARFLRDFWQPDLGAFALALTFDGAGVHPARVVASSPGHLLASRLLDGDDVAALRERLIGRLFEDDLLAGAGIRTRATGAARFRSGSYHNGSTWPVDTGIIADGLRRHGHADLAANLEDRILAACAAIGGFPEFFRGDADGRVAVNATTIDELVGGTLNRLEQPPQPNQGWTATRVWRILRGPRAEGSKSVTTSDRRPALRPMDDSQDLDRVVVDPVRHDVGRSRHNQLTGVGLLTDAPTLWEDSETPD
jgi:glycogen debranching enzyme